MFPKRLEIIRVVSNIGNDKFTFPMLKVSSYLSVSSVPCAQSRSISIYIVINAKLVVARLTIKDASIIFRESIATFILCRG